MDLSNFTNQELKKLRNKYKEHLDALKIELQTVKTAIDNPNNEIISKLKNIREKRVSKSATSNDEVSSFDDSDMKEEENVAEELVREVSMIKILDASMKIIKNEDDVESYVYAYNAKIDKLYFDIEYESNLPPHSNNPKLETLSKPTASETIAKLFIKIVRPNLQAKLQNAIDFYQLNPNYFSSAIMFLKSLSTLCEMRVNVVKKMYEFEKHLNIGISRSTEQHSIIFKSEFENVEFLHLKWNFKWNPKTGLARDIFTAKIIRADNQLLGEIKPLIEKLCSDNFALECTELEKVAMFRRIILCIKDADTRNISMAIA